MDALESVDVPAPGEIPAVILAAGQGSRLNGGRRAPKCLTPVLGRPLVAWIIDALSGAGVRTIHMILGSEAKQVEDALPSLTGPAHVRATRCPDWTLGNGRSAAHGETVLQDRRRFLLLMSDHLVSAAHVSAVLSSVRRGEACVLATARPGGTGLDLEDATKVLADDDGQIRQIGKELKRYNQIDTGVFSMTGALFPALARAAADGDHSLTGGNRGLAAQGLLFAQPIGDLPWQDVDTPEDLLAAECLAERFLRCGPRV